MKKFYSSKVEEKMIIKKLIGLNVNNCSDIFSSIKESKPHAKLLTLSSRNLSYSELPMSSLEYLWFGCEKADIKTRLYAKVSYMTRLNAKTNPRRDMLFSLEENMLIVKEEENLMLEKIYSYGSDTDTLPF